LKGRKNALQHSVTCRVIAALAALVVLVGGCGPAASEPAADARSPIQAVDEPAPADVEASFRGLAAGLPPNLKGSPEQVAFLEGITPAPDTEFRVVARLRLSAPRSGILELVTWRSRAGALCTLALARTAAGDAGGVGPNGPCVPVEPCGRLCAEQGQIDVAGRESTIVAGTVAADADVLRLALLGGGESLVRLDGPLVPGAPERRVVLVDLGRSSYGRVELLRDGRVVATREESAYDYASEDCIQASLDRGGDPVQAGCI
jgi:hypothetical protein